jgi:ATP-dependent DNA helicase RecG
MPIQDLPAAAVAPLIQELISGRESRQLEFKRVSGKMVGKALETVCAMANAAYFGESDR